MSGRRSKRARASRRTTASPAPRDVSAPREVPAPRETRPVVLYALTLLLPLVLLAATEGVLRLAWRGGALPVFVTVPGASDRLVANPRVARRWFAAESAPPTPIPESFAAAKPARAFRVFALGESTTAGFPYPHNGTFTRMLRDELRDVLPDDSVEVINLGIAATSSYAMIDMADAVIAQHPDAIVVYAGHNEYYGALAVGSTQAMVGGSPAFVRAYMRLQRLRLVLALRYGIVWAKRAFVHGNGEANAPSFMETQARDQDIGLGSAVYRRGVRQFDDNLSVLLRRFHTAGVPVFVGSLASNVRDQAPFAAPANDRPGSAAEVFARARRLLADGDTTDARAAFLKARDLDVVRFRAPGEFNDTIRAVAGRFGARYVPVGEAFDSAAMAHAPGSDLFLEHVHPNQRGYALIAQTFFDAIRASGFLGRQARPERLRAFADYMEAMDLTPFDERIVEHTTRTVTSRWPFVPVSRQQDYRATYRPTDFPDSLAFAVSAGAPWLPSKLRLGEWYERANHPDSAAAEYQGVVRDAPTLADGWTALGRARMKEKQVAEGEAALRRGYEIQPTAGAAYALGTLALQRKDLPTALALLRQSDALTPNQPAVLYQLSLAYALSRDIVNARATAARLWRMAPDYPGLAGWLRALGISPP
ncbi:MAG TPA: GDSL-type esterase/lipase family protein [Gemmatimonadaceae bacterium]